MTSLHWELDGGVCEFEHQVAGHTREILRRFEDKILKPCIKPDLFVREVGYYEEFSDPASGVSPIAFLPQYFGSCSFHEGSKSGGVMQYLCLEDLTREFLCPCAMDVKIGTQTFEPTASEEKKARERSKYVFQEELGFRITGFKTYNARTGTYTYKEKTYGRSLEPHEVATALQGFFHNGIELQKSVIFATVEKLEQMLRWFTMQRRYHFYCSSILIIFDGAAGRSRPCSGYTARADSPESPEKEGTDSPDALSTELGVPTSRVEVRMIDLAHIVRAEATEEKPADIDRSYVHGLRSLIRHLEIALYGESNDETPFY